MVTKKRFSVLKISISAYYVTNASLQRPHEKKEMLQKPSILNFIHENPFSKNINVIMTLPPRCLRRWSRNLPNTCRLSSFYAFHEILKKMLPIYVG